MDSKNVKTRFYIISDTHGEHLPAHLLPSASAAVDVAIHCGDLTNGSKICEFRHTLDLLKKVDAPLKLVIAGNHDFTLDTPMFKKTIAEVHPPLEPELVAKEYGDWGEARRLMDDAKEAGIVFLEEGTYEFTLLNGAKLTVYASPYTPSMNDWGFQYPPGTQHDWLVENSDVVITHGPPHGILDKAPGSPRLGCPSLFRAIDRARPKLHCFGHVHSGWGAKLVRWRDEPIEDVTHFTAIDNNHTTIIETLAGLTVGRFDDESSAQGKQDRMALLEKAGCITTSHCEGDALPIVPLENTLFVNAAVQGPDESWQMPWLVDLELPKALPDTRPVDLVQSKIPQDTRLQVSYVAEDLAITQTHTASGEVDRGGQLKRKSEEEQGCQRRRKA
ncbi:rhamnogalacturonate lyase C-like protein 2 [Elsinoe australis]|uniref:Rhamnogalacturonate lyase C-like protein 2 n=1 Tax=Elsinoe australis TaxID=40998 RepID=A0A4U7B945_9PEZI|nr:rhamnogalacturonate lyase C-like protein 2 [Elsinoe australis]